MPGFSASEEDWCVPALLDLAREVARDHALDIYTLRYPHHRSPYTVHGARVFPFGGAARAGVFRGPLLARAIATIGRRGRRGRYQVVHGFWADEPGFVAVAAARLLGRRTIVSVMGGELEAYPEHGYGGALSRVNRMLAGRALAGAATVTVGSRWLEYRLAPRAVEVLPLGIELDRFTPDGERAILGAGVPLIQVASLTPIKGHETTLRALERLAPDHPELTLHLIGDGPSRGRLERLVRRLALDDRVRFHGALPHHRLPAYYRAARLALSGSWYESQGMVLLEAAACGVPTVGSAVGLLPELFPALAVEPGNVGALAAAIETLVADDGARRRHAEAGLARVRAEYGLETSRDRLLYHYETVR